MLSRSSRRTADSFRVSVDPPRPPPIRAMHPPCPCGLLPRPMRHTPLHLHHQPANLIPDAGLPSRDAVLGHAVGARGFGFVNALRFHGVLFGGVRVGAGALEALHYGGFRGCSLGVVVGCGGGGCGDGLVVGVVGAGEGGHGGWWVDGRRVLSFELGGRQVLIWSGEQKTERNKRATARGLDIPSPQPPS